MNISLLNAFEAKLRWCSGMVGKGRCGDESATTTGRERKEVGKGKREREKGKGKEEAQRGKRGDARGQAAMGRGM